MCEFVYALPFWILLVPTVGILSLSSNGIQNDSMRHPRDTELVEYPFSPDLFAVGLTPLCWYSADQYQSSPDKVNEYIIKQLRTVKSRFSTVYLSVTKKDQFQCQVTTAIANLNQELMLVTKSSNSSESSAGVPINNSGNIMRAYLALNISAFTTLTPTEAEAMKTFADVANSIHNNTVEYIVLEDIGPLLEKNIHMAKETLSVIKQALSSSSFHYKLALKLDVANHCISSKTRNGLSSVSDMLNTIIFSVTRLDPIGNGELTAQRYIWYMDLCRQKFNKVGNISEIAFFTGYPMAAEAKMNGVCPDIKLIEFWQELNSWAESVNVKVVVQEAFDYHPEYVTNSVISRGWWRIIKTSDGNLEFEAKTSNPMEYSCSTKDDFTLKIFVSVLLILILVFLVCLLTLYIKYKQVAQKVDKSVLTKLEMNEFFNGHLNSLSYHSGEDCIVSMNVFTARPYDKENFEITLGNFFVERKNRLGSGNYGIVYCGHVNDKQGNKKMVAVKTVKPDCSHPEQALRGLLSEIKVLSYVGKHANIIELVGAYTEDLNKGKVFVFTELCSGGSLQNLLRKLKPRNVVMNAVAIENDGYTQQLSHESCSSSYSCTESDADEADEELLSALHRWAYEIACGMEFLASRHVVHADLATRNILLTDQQLQVKISDFGLSRKLYNCMSYFKKSPDYLPWPWMSPESLNRGVYNERTDVWAYGVTLWEIYTLGDQPFPGCVCNASFISELGNSVTLEKPSLSPNNIYEEVMLECWRKDPNSRHTFSQITGKLQSMFHVLESVNVERALGKHYQRLGEFMDESAT